MPGDKRSFKRERRASPKRDEMMRKKAPARKSPSPVGRSRSPPPRHKKRHSPVKGPPKPLSRSRSPVRKRKSVSPRRRSLSPRSRSASPRRRSPPGVRRDGFAMRGRGRGGFHDSRPPFRGGRGGFRDGGRGGFHRLSRRSHSAERLRGARQSRSLTPVKQRRKVPAENVDFGLAARKHHAAEKGGISYRAAPRDHSPPPPRRRSDLDYSPPKRPSVKGTIWDENRGRRERSPEMDRAEPELRRYDEGPSQYSNDVDYRRTLSQDPVSLAVERSDYVRDRRSRTSETDSKVHARDAISRRFAEINGEAHLAKFDPEENIMIDINRKIPYSSADKNRPVVFDVEVETFIFPRRPDEGVTKIFDRPEILARRYDEEEHSSRVIRVGDKKKQDSGRHPGSGDARRRSEGHKEDQAAIITADFHFVRQEQERVRQHKDTGEKKPLSSSKRKSSNTREGPKEEREEEVRVKREKKKLFPEDEDTYVPHTAAGRDFGKKDLRHNLLKKRQISEHEEEPVKTAGRKDGRRVEGRDLSRITLAGGERTIGAKAEREQLPDFKNRPDREHIEDFTADPLSVPKKSYYYEPRGRGYRGSFGRGGGAPHYQQREGWGYRGGRGYDREADRDTWKHDKFSELEGDNEITSTTGK